METVFCCIFLSPPLQHQVPIQSPWVVQEVEAELIESTRVLESQEQQLLAPKAAAKLAEENSIKRTEKLLQAVELSSKQVTTPRSHDGDGTTASWPRGRQALRGKLGSCWDRVGSCRDRVGSCRDRVGSCRDRVGSCRDRVGSCQDRMGSCRNRVSLLCGCLSLCRHGRTSVVWLRGCYPTQRIWCLIIPGNG